MNQSDRKLCQDLKAEAMEMARAVRDGRAKVGVARAFALNAMTVVATLRAEAAMGRLADITVDAPRLVG